MLNVPLVNQLASPDTNKNEDCVPASLSALLTCLTGRAYTVAEVKDAVYGISYTGPQSASAYVDYCATQGVKLWPYDQEPVNLVNQVASQLAIDHPCLGTIPSEWGYPWTGSGSTHVVCFADAPAGTLTAMNPWGGFWQEQSDEWWAARLAYGQIWIGANIVSAPTTTGAGPGFDAYAAEHEVTGALRAYGSMGSDQQTYAIYDADAAHPTGLVLHWAAGGAVADDQAADVALYLQETMAAALDKVAQLEQQLAAAQAAPAPAPAPGTPGDVQALAAIRAIKAALSEV